MDIKKLSNKDWQLLSDLLDGQLDAEKANQVQFRLEKEPALRNAYENLQWTRSLMRQVPHRKVPHNYILTRHMAAEAKKTTSFRKTYYGFASVLASLVFVVLLAIQLVPNLPFSGLVSKSPQTDEVALREMVMEDEAAPEEPAMELMAVPEAAIEESMDESEATVVEGEEEITTEEPSLAAAMVEEEAEAETEEEPMLEAFSMEAPAEESEELSSGADATPGDTMNGGDELSLQTKPVNWLFIATVVSGLAAFALVFINQKNRRSF